MTAMFNPSELEGEVDHSFFDSDCDSTSVGRDGGKKTEKGLKAGKESPPAHESPHEKQSTKGGSSLRSDGTKRYLKPVENNSSSKAERKENSCQSKEDQRSRSSLPSVAYTSEKVINYSSDSEEDSNLSLKRPNGGLMALLAEAREADYKDAYKSQNETEEVALLSNTTHSKGRNKPKKLIRNRCTRSPSPTSTDFSVEADSESSCSSGNGKMSSESPILPRPSQSSLSPGVRRMRVGSAGSQDAPEESEGTVTDVSPLSSPGSSPLQSLDLSHAEAPGGSLKEQRQQESVPSSGLGNTHQDEDSDQDVDDSSLGSESQLGDRLVFHCPGRRNRKNYSFTNDEVRCIDRENQRLLQQLSRLSPAPRPGSTGRKKTHIANNPPFTRPSHSALNRQREQQRIERENLAFLKRLESVKPTPGLNRSQQLTDYQRQVGYLGGPSYSICTPSQRERSASKMSTGPRRMVSSRVASTNSESRNSLAPRSKKLSAARPAWC